MADDWKPGDLALCIKIAGDDIFELEGSLPVAPGPIVGLVYTVKSVRHGIDCYGRSGVALALEEVSQRHPRSCGYNALCFRKVEAREADAEDAETIRLLNKRERERVE